MPPPYRADELVTALLEASRAEGLALETVDVVPDERAGVWIVRVRFSDKAPQRLVFPFASPRGIYTPAYIAAQIIKQTWPFG